MATAGVRLVAQIVEHLFLRRRRDHLEFAPPLGQALQFVLEQTVLRIYVIVVDGGALLVSRDAAALSVHI